MREEIYLIIEGPEINKLLNQCVELNIPLKKIVYISSTKVSLICQSKDIHHIERLTRNKYIVEKTNEKGIKSLANKISRRKSTVIGIIIFIALLAYQNMFIARIDLNGVVTLDEGKIRAVLAENGIFEGCKRDTYDLEATEYDIFEKVDGIAWMELHSEGGVITVDLVESVKAPIPSETEPINIVALKEGVVEEIITKHGTNLVHPGDYVYPGDILVTGAVVNKKDETIIRYLRAESEIYVRSIYIFNRVEQKIEKVQQATGKFFPGIALQFGDFKFDSGKSFKIFDNYNVNKESVAEISIPMPIKIELLGINEFREVDRERGVSEIKREAEIEMLKELKKNIGDSARIVKKDLQFSEEENIIEVIGSFEVIEEIGGEEPIVYDRIEN